jgi:hypothetical protein
VKKTFAGPYKERAGTSGILLLEVVRLPDRWATQEPRSKKP